MANPSPPSPSPSPSPSPLSPTRSVLSPLSSPPTKPPISSDTKKHMQPIIAAWKWASPAGKENASPSLPPPSPSSLERALKAGLPPSKGVKFADHAVVIGHGHVPVHDEAPVPLPSPTASSPPKVEPPPAALPADAPPALSLPVLPVDVDDDIPVHIHIASPPPSSPVAPPAPPPSPAAPLSPAPAPSPSASSPFTHFHPSLRDHPYHQALTAYDALTPTPPPTPSPPLLPPRKAAAGGTVLFRVDSTPVEPLAPPPIPAVPPPLPPRKPSGVRVQMPASPGAFRYVSPAQLGKHRRQRSKSVDLGSSAAGHS